MLLLWLTYTSPGTLQPYQPESRFFVCLFVFVCFLKHHWVNWRLLQYNAYSLVVILLWEVNIPNSNWDSYTGCSVMGSVSMTRKEWQLVLNAHSLTCSSGQAGSEPLAALHLLLWLERYNTYSLNFWTKLMVKSCNYWPNLRLSLQRIPMLGDLTHTHEREDRWDCKIVRMHECGFYFSTRKQVDY